MRYLLVTLVLIFFTVATLPQVAAGPGLDFSYLRQAIVLVGVTGTVFGPDKLIVSHLHGSEYDRPPFKAPDPSGYAALADYAAARGYTPPPPLRAWSKDSPYTRPVTLLCAHLYRDVTIWKMEDPPEDLPSLPLGRTLTGELWVLPPDGDVRAGFIGYERGGTGHVLFDLARPSMVGWSGSPIVNWKGELVAMHLGSIDRRISVAAPSEWFRCP